MFFCSSEQFFFSWKSPNSSPPKLSVDLRSFLQWLKSLLAEKFIVYSTQTEASLLGLVISEYKVEY